MRELAPDVNSTQHWTHELNFKRLTKGNSHLRLKNNLKLNLRINHFNRSLSKETCNLLELSLLEEHRKAVKHKSGKAIMAKIRWWSIISWNFQSVINFLERRICLLSFSLLPSTTRTRLLFYWTFSLSLALSFLNITANQGAIFFKVKGQ